MPILQTLLVHLIVYSGKSFWLWPALIHPQRKIEWFILSVQRSLIFWTIRSMSKPCGKSQRRHWRGETGEQLRTIQALIWEWYVCWARAVVRREAKMWGGGEEGGGGGDQQADEKVWGGGSREPWEDMVRRNKRLWTISLSRPSYYDHRPPYWGPWLGRPWRKQEEYWSRETPLVALPDNEVDEKADVDWRDRTN